MIKFEDLMGKEFDFYGVDNTDFKLDEYTFRALEDENDGYRSSLGSVDLVIEDGQIFHKVPIAVVTVRPVTDAPAGTYWDNFDGYGLIDRDGHEWVRIGTSNFDDYYPCFIFNYNPKAAG